MAQVEEPKAKAPHLTTRDRLVRNYFLVAVFCRRARISAAVAGLTAPPPGPPRTAPAPGRSAAAGGAPPDGGVAWVPVPAGGARAAPSRPLVVNKSIAL